VHVLADKCKFDQEKKMVETYWVLEAADTAFLSKLTLPMYNTENI
jgi:hypothetical protein